MYYVQCAEVESNAARFPFAPIFAHRPRVEVKKTFPAADPTAESPGAAIVAPKTTKMRRNVQKQAMTNRGLNLEIHSYTLWGSLGPQKQTRRKI